MKNFKKCLLTGSTGSGASFLIEYILKKDKRIKIFGLYRSKGYKKILNKYSRVKLINVDLNNKSKLQKIIKKINPDLIYHFASDPDVRKSFDDPFKVIKNNSLITLNLLECIRTLKTNPLIIICSTSEVYGDRRKKDGAIKENNTFNPANPYAVSKAFQDLLSQVYFKIYGLKIIITRMFTYMNPRRDNLFQSAFAKQIVEIKKNKKKFLNHGNLSSVRTFLDTEDACSAYWLTAKKGRIGEIYNISGDKIISVGNFLKKMISHAKIKKEIITKKNNNLIRKSDVSYQIANNLKFKKHTNWRPKVSLSNSINNILNYFDKNLN